jgi:large subunit ribosomal protein L21
MYAVIRTGGRQHRVQVGEIVRVDRLDLEAGETVVFDQVLSVGEGDSMSVGTPTVAGASVDATVVEQGRGKKVLIFRYRPRKNASRRRAGHRQDYTAVKIEAIHGT